MQRLLRSVAKLGRAILLHDLRVVREAAGARVLDACARKFGIQLALDHFDWSCDNYDKIGSWMPADWRDQIGGHECLFFGATGWPAKVPDHVSLWDSLIKFRRDFDQYVNMRPVKLMPGIRSPLADRKPGDIDFIVVRENTEGEYSAVGGRMYGGTDREAAMQQSIFTRQGTDRIMKYAFELAKGGWAGFIDRNPKVNVVGSSVAPLRSVLSAGLMASMALRCAAEARKPASQSVTEVKLPPVAVTA